MKNMFINIALVSMMVFSLFVCADENNTEHVYRDSIKLRHGYQYGMSLSFLSNDYKSFIRQIKTTFHEDGDMNEGDNPIFDYTDEIKKSEFILNKNENKVISHSSVYYKIIRHPVKRSKDNINIVFDLTYHTANTAFKNWSDKKHFIDHQPYEVTWCGDGIVDNYTEALSSVKIHEECDPGDGNWENSGCKINECTLLKR